MNNAMKIGDFVSFDYHECPPCPRCGKKLCCELDRQGEVECEKCGAVFDYEISFEWYGTLKDIKLIDEKED